MNEVVLVTGASSGIGYALCKEFAKENTTIVAIGRNTEALEKLKHECNQKHFYYLSKDLTDPDAVEVILEFLHEHKLVVTTLVNNAAIGIWGDFAHTDIDLELNLAILSITFYMKFTKALLPDMLKNKKGTILNIGSVYSFMPVPNQSVYAACKAFLLNHSIALRHELEDDNIHVCICCPGMTRTSFHKNRKSSSLENYFSMSAEEVAKITLKDVKKNKGIIIPGMLNKLAAMACRMLPMNFMAEIIYRINISRKVHK
jgi:short-subunit dehydrogenase